MRFHGTEVAAIAALAGAGCAVLLLGLRTAVQRAAHHAVRARQAAMEREIHALAATVRALQARVAELSRAAAQQQEIPSIAAEAEDAGEQEKPRVKPEVLAAMTAAATAFLGKRARIRAARLMPAAQDGAGAWAQQGRVFVQTSHNLPPRG